MDSHLTKKERRRQLLLDQHWLSIHGSPERPRHFARNIRKHLMIR